MLLVARSERPSPLKSPATMAYGPVPTAYVPWGWKVPSPLPRSTDTVSSCNVSDGEVELAVAVEVTRHDAFWDLAPTRAYVNGG